MKKIKTLVIFSMLMATHVSANQWSYRGVVDGFYTAHTAMVPTPKAYPFVYAYPDSNRIALNQALLELRYDSEAVYGYWGMQAGRYVDENYVEPLFVRSIYSAFLGKKLSETLAIEGGIMSSHIGFESAIGPENWTLSRSVLADNSPYFESGLKLIYTPNNTWTMAGLLLNGWQNIADPETLALGTQVQWKPNPNLLLNSSAFIGQVAVEDHMQDRYFHDFFAVMTLSEQLSLASLADIGLQKSDTGRWHTWSGAAIIGQWKQDHTRRWGARVEFFSDPEEMVSTGVSTLWRSSLNMDWDLSPTMMWRNEIKQTWLNANSDLQFSTALALHVKGDLL